MRDEKEMRWRTLSSETLIARPWLTARRDKVELPDGSIYDEYYVLHYPTWINVIAETEDGRLILERQYRHALRCGLHGDLRRRGGERGDTARRCPT